MTELQKQLGRPGKLVFTVDMVIGLLSSRVKTRSCYFEGPVPCGACDACFRRWVSFKCNGIEETMENNILEWEGTLKYINKMKKGLYDQTRTDETFKALELAGVSI